MNKFKTAIAMACMITVHASGQAQSDTMSMTIEQLFTLIDNNKHLQVARQGIEVAQHGVDNAKSQRLPDIGAQLALTYNGNVLMTDRDFSNAQGFSQPHFGNSLVVEAQQVVYAGGAIDAGIRLAELQKDMAANGLSATRNAQRFLTLSQYLEMMRMDNAVKVYEHNIALTETLIGKIKDKRRQGMALANDITRQELQLENLKMGLRKMNDARDIANHQLANSLGLNVNTRIQPDTTLTSPTGMVPTQGIPAESQWINTALASSADAKAAELDIQIAQQQLKLAKSEMMPKVALMATDNFSGPFQYDIPPIDKNFNVWFVGVGVKYQLSSLFKSNKRIKQAQAKVTQASESQATTAESIDNKMQEAHTLFRQAEAELITKQKSAQLARENYGVIHHRYLNDLALATDMTDAANILLSAELDETNARIAILFAYYKMKFVAGTL